MKKTRVNELAILGGAPAFAEPQHVGRPNVGDRDALLRRINDMLDLRWFTNNGPYVRELEERIAALVGVRHCILVSSGTTALELTIRATGMTGEAIVPAYTFVATAHALQWLGLTPVFCDIDRRTHNLDPARLERLLTPRTSGIIGVHLWGRPCAVEALADIAARRNLVLLFDAAHGFGCSHGTRMIGSFGRAEIFSFTPRSSSTLSRAAPSPATTTSWRRKRACSATSCFGLDTVIALAATPS
jgi:dTDP-4-amino-4,6-dideoxygalactose transaminase